MIDICIGTLYLLLLLLTENSGKAEIAELDDSIFGEQNVFWLHITMNTIV